MSLRELSPFKQRLVVSGIIIVILIIVIGFALTPVFKPIFSVIMSSIIGIAVWEYYQIARSKGFSPLSRLGIGSSVAYILALCLQNQYYFYSKLPLAEILLVLSLLSGFLYYFIKGSAPLVNLAITFFAFSYLTVPLGCLVSITYFFRDSLSNEDGRLWLFYIIAVAKMTDVGAYLLGKKFGRQSLAPYISPKKTTEGLYGGLFIGTITSVIFSFVLSTFFAPNYFSLSIYQSLALGVIIAVLASLGDLAESLLKREGGIKDSNHLPGLGGVLDVVDSLVFAAPMVYFFLRVNFH